MQTTPPVVGQSGLVQQQQQLSVSQAVNNNLDFSYPQTVDTHAWPDTFIPANLKCTLVRVGANGTTPASGYSWTAANTKIAHNLGRLPVGWIIVYKDKVCDVFAPNATKNDGQFIYLTISDDTANTTLLIF